MPSPQLKNGYIKIATEIWEALTNYRISGEEMKCLMFIIRKTYGWNKKQDAISLYQFSQATDMVKPSVCRAINKLKIKNIIFVSKKANRNIPTYEFNKKYTTWKTLTKKLIINKKANLRLLKSKSPLANLLIPTLYTKDTITKDTITKERKRIFNQKEFDAFYSYYPKKVAKKEALTRWQKLIKSQELPELPEILSAIEKQKEWRNNSNGKFRPEWKNPATWLNKGCWEDDVNPIQSETDKNSEIDIYGDD